MTTHTLTEEVARRLRWSTFMGVLTAAIGVVMILYPFATAAASTVFLGAALLVAAAVQVAYTFTSRTAGDFFLKLLLAVVYGIGGIALAFFPLAGVVTLTAVLGAMLVAEAILETALAFALPAAMGRGWLLLGALFSLVLGLLVLFQWPNSSVWAIGTLLGTAVLVNGTTRAALSSSVRRDLRAARPTPTTA
ncbi:MAG TPA: DUF308 domain-containing protein [Vicinamibacteria bacterium]|nr:DUF308 domain-containing protein [Vicinamibacteria bacterium]